MSHRIRPNGGVCATFSQPLAFDFTVEVHAPADPGRHLGHEQGGQRGFRQRRHLVSIMAAEASRQLHLFRGRRQRGAAMASLPLSIGADSRRSLERESVAGIDPAMAVSTTRGGHALGVAGELAIPG